MSAPDLFADVDPFDVVLGWLEWATRAGVDELAYAGAAFHRGLLLAHDHPEYAMALLRRLNADMTAHVRADANAVADRLAAEGLVLVELAPAEWLAVPAADED